LLRPRSAPRGAECGDDAGAIERKGSAPAPAFVSAQHGDLLTVFAPQYRAVCWPWGLPEFNCSLLNAGGHVETSAGNMITRASARTKNLDLDIVYGQYLPNHVFLLYSDGLTRMLHDDQIAALLERPIASAVDALIGVSLEHGAPDNVTVVAVHGLD
jgi:hypothetical protein